jgi:hypothetical protein
LCLREAGSRPASHSKLGDIETMTNAIDTKAHTGA